MRKTGVKVWYRVRDLASARAFYVDLLGFEEIYRDTEGRWARLRRGEMGPASARRDGDRFDRGRAGRRWSGSDRRGQRQG